jgi:carbon monoxide dehydrogenase subunit G
MAKVNGSIYIDRPPEVVFDFVADERNEPRYNPKMTTVALLTEEPIGVGSRFGSTLMSRARPVTMTVEFTEFVRPRRLALVSTAGAMDTVGALSFAPSGRGTLMTWSWNIRLRGLAKVASPVVAWMGRRQERATWDGAKRCLEGGEQAGSA